MSVIGRRTFLAALAAVPAAAAVGDRPVARFSFDEGLANLGEWGGAITTQGPTPDEPLIKQRDGAGVADLTSGWFQSRGGRLVYSHARIGVMDSFSASLCFNALHTGAAQTLLTRQGQWRVWVDPAGILQVNLFRAPSSTQALPITAIAAVDAWHQIAFSFDRATMKLYWAYRQVGAAGGGKSGTFTLVSTALGPDTDHSRATLDIGSNQNAERLYGYLDNLALWDRSLPSAELAAVLEASQPSLRRVGLESFERYLMPLEREPAAALPNRSDVCMSSRSWRSAAPGGGLDTVRDLQSFAATRLEWIYETTPARIRQVKDTGVRFIATINGNDAVVGRPNSIRDFSGQWVSFAWMLTWRDAQGLPPGAGCVNNPGFREQQIRGIRTALANGADGIQYDDWAANNSVFATSGECLCEHCLAAFRVYLKRNHTVAEMTAWGVDDPDSFDYRRFLASSKKIASQAEYLQFSRKSQSDPLHAVYNRFQVVSIREALAALHEVAARERLADGRKPSFSLNSSVTTISQKQLQFGCADLADYAVFEQGDESLEGVVFYSKAHESLQKISVMSPFPWVKDKTRADLALRYAFGQLGLVPYDVYMRSTDTPRAFGTPAQYGDLFAFVREHADLFDRMQTVATVGIAVDTGKAEDPRLRPLVRALALASVPFVLLPLGRDWFEASPPLAWCVRVPYVIDLSGLPGVRKTFPNSRFLGAAGSADDIARILTLEVESPGVMGVVRGTAEDGRRALAIHLVNYNFDEFGAAIPIKQCGVRLFQRDFWGEIRSAEALAPGAAAERLAVEEFGRNLRVVVPLVHSWTVLRLEVA